MQKKQEIPEQKYNQLAIIAIFNCIFGYISNIFIYLNLALD